MVLLSGYGEKEFTRNRGTISGLCVAMEPNHAISISGHKITIFTELMSANDTYRTLSIKFI